MLPAVIRSPERRPAQQTRIAANEHNPAGSPASRPARRRGWSLAARLLVLGPLALGGLLALGPARVGPSEPLVPLARPGPWSGISGLIGYGARLWFVNSVKFVDHNSADLYSYDPRAGRSRYERHLFSQDAGDPAVGGGLLYWPFEDARFSAGRGEYLVTDGHDWQWRILPHGEVFHVHAMAAHGGALFAATSGWRAGLQRSDDGGLTWRVIYDHATPAGSVSRLTTLAALDRVLYAGLTSPDQEGVKLLATAGGTLRPVAGWPPGEMVTALRAYRGWLYGVNVAAGRRALWRSDGTVVERVGGLDGEAVRALAAGPDALWAVSARGGGGTLWRSADGTSWSAEQRFEGAEPLDVAVYAGRVYVGTAGPGGRGTLWGPAPPAPAEAPLGPRPLPPAPRRLAPGELPGALRALDAALGDPSSYAAHGARLRAALEPLAQSGLAEAGPELARRLDAAVPDIDVVLFGGRLSVPAAWLARWYLLWAVALDGHGRVPPALLAEPWTARPNRAEKYLDPAPAAAWAAAQVGQADPETLASLIARLGSAGQPPWLEGDLVGALTALTGERFGYDVAAWRDWWARRGKPARSP